MAKPPSAKPAKATPTKTAATTPDGQVFTVDTRFHRMALRAGGVTRAAAIERAAAEIEEAKAAFDAWLDHELEEFAALVKAARAGKADADWAAGANMRSQELRDTSATLGFELLSYVASSLCALFDSAEAGTAHDIDGIACHIDALNLAKQKSYRRLKPEQVPELTEGLRRVVGRGKAGPPAAGAA
jgi:hypothetical protein